MLQNTRTLLDDSKKNEHRLGHDLTDANKQISSLEAEVNRKVCVFKNAGVFSCVLEDMCSTAVLKQPKHIFDVGAFSAR